LNQAKGVTIAPDGVIWITDTCNDRIVRVPMDRFWRELRTTSSTQ
jgi:sugar lactone lactonase YvrE